MAWIAPLIAGGASLFANDQASKRARDAQDEQKRLSKEALERLAAVSIPTIAEQDVVYDRYASVGDFDPTLENLIQQGPTSFEQIALDPQTRAKQMEALQSLNDYSKAGFTDADKMALELVKQNALATARGQNNAVLRNMQERGMGGSGAELLAKLKGNQAATSNMSQMEMQQAMQAQANKMAALNQMSQLAGQVRAQDYGEQSDLARARDVINAANTQNSIATQSRNVGYTNAAKQGNLAKDQSIADRNTGLRNAEKDKHSANIQTNFQNRFQQAGGIASQLGQIGKNAMEYGANDASAIAATGKAIGDIAMAGGKMYKDWNKPEDEDE